MKIFHLFSAVLIILITVFDCSVVFSQTGSGIEYSYGAGGFRTLRQYNVNSSLFKQSTNTGANNSDTLVIVSKDSRDPSNEGYKLFARVYPNPAVDIIYVENDLWSNEDMGKVVLFDLLGNRITEKAITSSRVSIAIGQISVGTYELKYYVNNGIVANWKVVKL